MGIGINLIQYFNNLNQVNFDIYSKLKIDEYLNFLKYKFMKNMVSVL